MQEIVWANGVFVLCFTESNYKSFFFYIFIPSERRSVCLQKKCWISLLIVYCGALGQHECGSEKWWRRGCSSTDVCGGVGGGGGDCCGWCSLSLNNQWIPLVSCFTAKQWLYCPLLIREIPKKEQSSSK